MLNVYMIYLFIHLSLDVCIHMLHVRMPFSGFNSHWRFAIDWSLHDMEPAANHRPGNHPFQLGDISERHLPW